MYQARAIKYLETSRGVAYTATIYRAGRKVGSLENHGDGGATVAHWNTPGEQSQFRIWAADTLDVTDDEPALDALLDISENDQASRGAVLVRLDPGADGPDEFRSPDIRPVTIPTGGTREQMIAVIAARYPSVDVWDTDSHRWVPVANV